MTSVRRAPGFPARRAPGLAGPALLLAAALAAAGARQEEPFDAVALSGELGGLRVAAADPDAALGAIVQLTEVLDRIESLRGPEGSLPEIETELYLRALEYRARAQLTRGAVEPAADDLRLVVLADPTRSLDLTGLTPAVLDLFELQRTQLLAHISVYTEPPGATVLVADRPVGQTPLVGHPVFAGGVRLRVERPGYRAVDEGRRELLPGDILSFEYELERTGPVLPVVTAPAGATVRVGGRVAGVTEGELPDALRPLVPPRFAGESFSAPLDLAVLGAGANEIVLEAPCRRPARFVFHADEVRDYLPRFIRLGPSTGGLRIESDPGGGTVRLDGEDRGVTPLSFSAMCSGPHDVEIRHAVGRCSRSVTVARGQRTAVSCVVRPAVIVEPAGPDRAPEIDRAVRGVLESHEGFFFLPDGDDGNGVQVRIRVEVPEPGRGPSRIGLLAAGSSKPDYVVFDRFDPEGAAEALEGLLEAPERRRPWTGFTATVRRIREPVDGRRRILEVIALHPGGPAELAGVELGDEVREVGGAPVHDELGLRQAVSLAGGASTLDVLVRREGADRLLHLVLGETPVLPRSGAARCNRRLVELEAEFARGAADAARRLEAAACWTMLDDPARALRDHLPGLDSAREAGPDAGVGRGTALYLRGAALLALGDRARAVEAFEAAAAVPGAALVSHDGPALAPLARRRAAKAR